MYTTFATVYDQLMAEVPYEKWAMHYLRLIKKAKCFGEKCVECACGSGSLTIPLQKAGMKMTGVDFSESMLEIAIKRAGKAGETIPFIHQDMCKFSLPSTVGVVLCTCDGVNYLTKEKQLSSFFACAYHALGAGGALIFDVSTPYKLLEFLGDTRTYVEPSYAYIWHNAVNKIKRTVKMDLTIFTKNPTNTYDRTEETQVQRAWEMQELTQALEKAGFSSVMLYSNMSMQKAKEQDTRWHIVATK